MLVTMSSVLPGGSWGKLTKLTQRPFGDKVACHSDAFGTAARTRSGADASRFSTDQSTTDALWLPRTPERVQCLGENRSVRQPVTKRSWPPGCRMANLAAIGFRSTA